MFFKRVNGKCQIILGLDSSFAKITGSRELGLAKLLASKGLDYVS